MSKWYVIESKVPGDNFWRPSFYIYNEEDAHTMLDGLKLYSSVTEYRLVTVGKRRLDKIINYLHEGENK